MRLDTTPPDDTASTQGAIEVRVLPPDAGFAAAVLLLGEHDLATAPEIDAVLSTIDGSALVDLSACTFIDSSVIGTLVSASQQLTERGFTLEIVAPPENPRVARIFEIVEVRELVVIHPASPIAAVDA